MSTERDRVRNERAGRVISLAPSMSSSGESSSSSCSRFSLACWPLPSFRLRESSSDLLEAEPCERKDKVRRPFCKMFGRPCLHSETSILFFGSRKRRRLTSSSSRSLRGASSHVSFFPVSLHILSSCSSTFASFSYNETCSFFLHAVAQQREVPVLPQGRERQTGLLHNTNIHVHVHREVWVRRKHALSSSVFFFRAQP